MTNLKPVNRLLDVVIVAGICLLVLLIYWQVRHHLFVAFDDYPYITENLMVRGGLSLAGTSWAFTTFHEANWHPLTWLSHQLDVELFGLAAGGHHLHNLLLHALNAVLLYTFLRRSTSTLWRSALVAAIFAVHPLRVESVAWAAERKDVLAAFFALLTLHAYLAFCRNRSCGRYLLLLLCFALGLMSKPMLVTVPCLLLLLDYWPLDRVHASGRGIMLLIWEKIPLFCLSAASGFVTFLAQQQGGTVRTFVELSLPVRLENSIVSYLRYIGHTLYPVDLIPFYPIKHPIPAWHIAISLLLLTAITFGSLRYRQNYRYLPVGWFWFLGMLVPAIGLIQVGDQALADRYTYLPTIGLSIMIVWGACDLLQKSLMMRKAATACAGLTLILLTFTAWKQTATWHDSLTLFKHAADIDPTNFLAELNLGVALQEAGRDAEAIPHYNRSLQLLPAQAYAHNNLGTALDATGHPELALRHYRAAIAINGPNPSSYYYNLGISLARLGKLDEALTANTSALRYRPNSADLLNNQGYLLLAMNRPDEAVSLLERAVQIQPSHIIAHLNLASAMLKRGRYRDAANHYQATLAIEPNQPEAQQNLKMLQEKGLLAGTTH